MTSTRRGHVVAVSAAAAVAAVAAVAVTRRRAARTERFDPVAVGRWECRAWAGYYRREWGEVLVAAVGMVASGFRMGPVRTLLGAWHVLRANQAWAPYPDNDPDAAREHMRRFYALVRRSGRADLDPVHVAGLEVEWWRVHRAHQHGAGADGPDSPDRPDSTDRTDSDALTDALDALYAAVYGIPAGTAREAARLRMAAMELSDRWVAAGCDRADPLLVEEQRVLVASYTALLAAT